MPTPEEFESFDNQVRSLARSNNFEISEFMGNVRRHVDSCRGFNGFILDQPDGVQYAYLRCPYCNGSIYAGVDVIHMSLLGRRFTRFCMDMNEMYTYYVNEIIERDPDSEPSFEDQVNRVQNPSEVFNRSRETVGESADDVLEVSSEEIVMDDSEETVLYDNDGRPLGRMQQRRGSVRRAGSSGETMRPGGTPSHPVDNPSFPNSDLFSAEPQRPSFSTFLEGRGVDPNPPNPPETNVNNESASPDLTRDAGSMNPISDLEID
jgi:hypothetical protein